MEKKLKAKTNKGLIFLGVFIIILGVSISVIIFINNISNSVDKGIRVVAPGEEIITLEETGKYIVFHEYKSTYRGKVYNSSTNISGLNVRIYNMKNDKYVELLDAGLNSKYIIGGRSGYAIFKFAIDEAGEYKIETFYDNSNEDEAILNISKNMVSSLVINILILVFSILASLGIGLGTIVYAVNKKKDNIDYIHY